MGFSYKIWERDNLPKDALRKRGYDSVDRDIFKERFEN